MTNNTDIKNQTNPMSGDLLRQIIRLGFPVAIQSALVAILALADVLMVSDFGKKRQRLWELRQNGISWRS